jgi:hypothetical protein
MEVSGQLHALTALSLEKELPGTHSIPVWMLRRKSLASVGNRTLALQPVTRRYTDWAIIRVAEKTQEHTN